MYWCVHVCTHTHTLKHTHIHTHSSTHTHSHHIHTHARIQTQSYTHTHTLNQRRTEITRQGYSSAKEGTWRSKRLYGKPIWVSSLSIFSTYGVAVERFPCHKIDSQIDNDSWLQNNTVMKYLSEARNSSIRIELGARCKIQI